MGNHHDSIALDWVRGEIQDTLKQGQQALEAYVDNRDDTARLRFCLNYLHQVHGTLQMVELYGAALLTEEMEKLAQAILNDATSNVDEAIEVLMQAILQLPQYLEHLDSHRDDFPLALLPLLNDLRAARGEALLSDTSLFKPDLSAAEFRANPAASQRLQDPKVLGHVRKLRQMFQFALVGIIREAELDSHFDYMDKVIQRVIKLCQGTPRGELWQAAGGFLDTLKSRHNSINSAVKSLLRQLDAELKRLLDEHGDILQQPVPEALFKHLLYYVARADDLGIPRVNDLRSRYKLAEALPSDETVDDARRRVSGPGREAIHSVVSALNEELARLKDQLDLFVRAEFRQNSELEELLPGLQQVANTLAVLGLGIPRRVVTEQIEIVQRLSRDDDPADDGILMDIAGALLYVEATLAGLEKERQTHTEDSGGAVQYGTQELNDANRALLRESRNSLEQVKTAIVNFIAAQWDRREIEHVPGLLHSIRGGLQLVPLERVCNMLASAERYVTDVLLDGQRVPDWQQLDTLADMVTSIEYYLERLAEGIEDNESVLKIAEDSLRSLGFPVGEEPTWSNQPAAAPAEEETLQAAPEPDAPKASDADLVDDEILEIFIEEAEEVLTTIRDFYPRLRQDHDDREALTEVRRAFHTLKGSGRLVGATSIGELAWAVENLLNRVIDQSIRPTDELFSLVDTVIERVPGLITEFRDGSADGDVNDLIAQADALATTRKTGPDSEASAEPAIDEAEPAAESEPGDAAAEPAEPVTPTADESPDDDLIDDEILEIFIEEAGEVLETIREYLPMLLRQFDDRTALAEVRRAFHTLKGSGRMVGASVVGELAWAVENMLNRVIDGSVFMNDDIARLLDDVVGVIPTLVSDFEARQPASLDTASLEARATALANGEIPESSRMPEDNDSTHVEPETATTAAPSQGLSEHAEGNESADEQLVDPVLLDIFESETETHLQALKQFLAEAEGRETTAYTDGLSRALHTLKGSAHTAGIEPLATLISPLEKFVKTARAENHRADRDVMALLADACDFIERGLEQIRSAPQQPLAGTDAFLERLDMLAARTLSSNPVGADDAQAEQRPDPQLIQLFLNEGLDILLDADSILDAWAAAPGENEQLDKLVLELRQLARGAEIAGLTDVSSLADRLERTYAAVFDAKAQPDSDFFDVARAGHEALINMMDQVAAGLATKPDAELLDRLQVQLDQFREQANSSFDQELDEIDSSFEEDLELPTLEVVSDDVSDAAGAEMPAGGDTELDPELVDIFLEEAADLIEGTGERLQQWTEQPSDTELLRHLQRDLHTLKGGARLADIRAIGDLSHELETLFEGLTDNRLNASDDLEDLLLRSHDRLAAMVDAISAGDQPRPAPDLVQEIQAYISSHAGSSGATAIDEPEDDLELPQLEVTEADEADEYDAAGPDEDTPTETGALQNLDPELAEIFLEEAGDIIDTTAEQLHQWQANPDQPQLVKELQRELHTLKGGARMAEIAPVADIAHEMETLFERIVEGRLAATPERTDVALRAHDQLAAMVDAIAENGECPDAPDVLAALKSALTDTPAAAPATDEAAEVEAAADQETEAPEAEADESVFDDALLVEAMDQAAADEDSDAEDLDQELVSIFLEEAYDLVNSTASTLHSWTEDPSNTALAGELQRDVHTLKGGARMAGADAIGDLTHVLEDLFERVAEGRLDATSEMTDLLFACHDRLAQMVEQVAAQKPCEPATALIERVQSILAGRTGETPSEDRTDTGAPLETQPEAEQPSPATETVAEGETLDRDDDLIGIFLDEGVEIHDAIKECLAQWRDEPETLGGMTSLLQELHTLKGGARLADVDPIADLAETWSERLESTLADFADSTAALALSERASNQLAQMLRDIEEGRAPVADTGLIDALAQGITPVDDEAATTADSKTAQPESVDPEVLEIFLEEAGELLDQIENLLEDWRKEPSSNHFNRELQRALHTLKGGARLAQLVELGDKAHAFETRLIDLGGNEPDGATWNAITRDHDILTDMVGDIRRRYENAGDGPVTLPATPENKADTPVAPTPATEQSSEPVGEARPEPQAKPHPKPQARNRKADPARAAQETIRVNAPLLDELVNLAGETSITRSRLEQQSSDFSHTLDEMAATIERLREQLRRMDIETEAQILFRAEKEHGPDYGEDFDPLEMDRYSSIQQLSRALSESASDLADLRETMSDRTRDTETLLVQQSRINTELQEGLMKTRMNPFASMVPRLRRIVRQISGELNKKVEFDVRNAEGEMDRNILERMVAPLEHMLRNALDHGIETPEERRKAGKPETGEIILSLTREGGEVVLRMMDDGAGIRTSAVREKAIKQGLLREDEDLSDREILQFILQPGFSTAAQVTQISGRGVGMDVVASEIKQLGGSLDISSVLGEGTTFTVRLPFTVSVNRALMVSTGEDFYAIPLNTIEGIVRVSTYELEEYYKPDAPLYEYAGQQYRLQYLGGLLHSEHHPKLQGQALPLPVILVRGAEQPMALQVDSLMGSREIVVKSLGPQFSSVRGVSGATILGDGNVVVILDLPAMIRSDMLSERQRLADLEAAQAQARREDRETLVMVVDDSVTVRKVTSRLLERNGMVVITAKDGLDAVAQLQDHRPDIILLDIEMPRMDGFEVASFVRHDDSLRDTPICMITSRTGQKHRERALALGVNEYLGKPFQETQLLDTIERLTGNQ
ncbi:hybrid sensor histidine kinase/response regulator [Marinobacter halodurans]|uniref:histidine kinase n=1 Tax=Marinobacter halodurans TaxID=2528979 RepID=A0ABY1ZLB0_9GAMM|nr:Hpt domain-containing protein [Marinobacter halodurans]TBW54865.1 hybrid sensor histidine kinase/response regulator [Marinobacter halodurans]